MNFDLQTTNLLTFLETVKKTYWLATLEIIAMVLAIIFVLIFLLKPKPTKDALVDNLTNKTLFSKAKSKGFAKMLLILKIILIIVILILLIVCLCIRNR